MSTRSSSSRAALALLALGLAACPRGREDAEAYAARNAVVRYNQALVEAYRASRADLLTQAASPAEISRVAAIISGLASRGEFMEARQTSFQVTRTEVTAGDTGPVSARVDATETWTYEHRALSRRDAPVAPKTVDYHLTYLLEPSESGWRVGKVLDQEHPLAGGAR